MAVVRVLFSCTGVGILNRGIESFFRECFDGLSGMEGLELRLLKGRGADSPDEKKVWCIPRTGNLAKWIGHVISRSPYTVEQLSSFLPVVRHVISWRPDVIYYSDANLGFQLFRWRSLVGVPYRLLYSNGAPVKPPFTRTDHVHQVTPVALQEAMQAGEPSGRHTFVPYGIRVPGAKAPVGTSEKDGVRQHLELPRDRKIVLSVGWISAVHKRMDFLVDEVAMMNPRPFLVMLGSIDRGSEPIIQRARTLLGRDGFAVRSVRYEEVGAYYSAADVFCLASLNEGFGRVYLEALAHGLPTIAHDAPVMRYVLGHMGHLADLRRPGALAEAIQSELIKNEDPALAAERREFVRRRYSWDVLRPQYKDMFIQLAGVQRLAE